MTRTSSGTILALLIGAGLALAPAETRAQGARGSMDAVSPGVSPGRPSFSPGAPPAVRPPAQPVAPIAPPPPSGFPMPGQPGGSFPNQPGFPDRFPNRNPTFIYSPSIVYGVPYPVPVPYDSGGAPYDDPSYPGYGGAPSLGPGAPVSGFSPPPSSPPPDVQYPNGRYELRGDGGSTPYQWVWIPNPPPPPPPPPPGPPGMTGPPASPEPSVAAPRAREMTVYRWTDAEGIVHFTDSFDSVPKEYRSQAKPGL